MLRSALEAAALSLVLLGAGTGPVAAHPLDRPSPGTGSTGPTVTTSAATVRTPGARALATAWQRRAAASPAAGPALWALTTDTAEIVRWTVGAEGGLVRTVLADLDHAVQFEVGPDGAVWVLDLGAGQLLRIGPDGTRTVVRSMTPYRSGFALDAQGDVVLYDVEQGAVQRVVRIDAATGRRTLLGTLTRIQAITVDGAGHALVAFDDPVTDQLDSALARYPVAGGLPTVRHLTDSDVLRMRATPWGDVLFTVDPRSRAGVDSLLRWDHLAGGVVVPTTKTSTYGWNLDPGGRLFLMQQRSWCAAPNLPGECRPPRDTSVDTVLVSPPGGGSYRRPVAVSGIPSPPGNLSVDARGTMAFAADASDGGGLKVLLPWGGPAVTVAAGTYYDTAIRSS